MRVGFCSFRRQGRVYFRSPLKKTAGSSLFILALAVLLLSCSEKEEIQLVPPATPPLSRGEVGYGVVSVSYTHVADQPGGLSLGYLRRGSVVRVMERRAGPAEGAWVLVEGRGDLSLESPGWIPETLIDVYPTEAQARTASESLLQ
jgi:hypothetical protein